MDQGHHGTARSHDGASGGFQSAVASNSLVGSNDKATHIISSSVLIFIRERECVCVYVRCAGPIYHHQPLLAVSSTMCYYELFIYLMIEFPGDHRTLLYRAKQLCNQSSD
jgi:hypothetical protein